MFESKFDRNSDFETPVTVFILQVERYAVTSGVAAVGEIEQPESRLKPTSAVVNVREDNEPFSSATTNPAASMPSKKIKMLTFK